MNPCGMQGEDRKDGEFRIGHVWFETPDSSVPMQMYDNKYSRQFLGASYSLKPSV